MAFGFPAYHQHVSSYADADPVLVQAVMETVDALHWEVTEGKPNYLTGKTVSGGMALGERIYIEIHSGQVGLRSECAIPTQCVDFGKNKRNVERFFENLNDRLTLERNPA